MSHTMPFYHESHHSYFSIMVQGDKVTTLQNSGSPAYPSLSNGMTGGTGGARGVGGAVGVGGHDSDGSHSDMEDRYKGRGGSAGREGGDGRSDDEAVKYERLLERKKIRPPRVKKEKYVNKFEKRARVLIKDFEEAVKENPDAWSASPFPSWSVGAEGFPTDNALSISNNISTVRVDKGKKKEESRGQSTLESMFASMDTDEGTRDESDDEDRDGEEAHSSGGEGRERREGMDGRDARQGRLSKDDDESKSSRSSKRSDSTGYESESSFEVTPDEDDEDDFEAVEENIQGLSHWHSVDPQGERMEEIADEDTEEVG